MLLLVTVMAITETLGVLSIMPFLSVLGRPEVIHEQVLLHLIYQTLNFSSEHNFIVALGFASIVVVLVSSAFKTVAQHLLNRFVHLQRYALSSRLLSTYLHQPYEFFLSRNSAELSKNVLAEIDQIFHNLIQPISQLIAQGVIVLAMTLLIVLYEPLTALVILLVIGGLYGSIYGLVRNRLGIIGKEMVTSNSERYQACNEAFGGIRDIKITHSSNAYQNLYNHAARTHARHQATNDTISQTPLYMVEAVGYTGLLLLALSLLLRSNDIAHVLPALGMYAFAGYRLLPAVQIMYRGVARLRFSTAVLENIHQDLMLPWQSESHRAKKLVPKREIRLDNIRFAYPVELDKPVFNHYSLSIAANTTTGISGKSGAGKSTLMDLLLGLVTPQSGSIWVDDVQICADNLGEWHNAIGYVPQHIYLVDASVASNIAFGVPMDKVDWHAVERAARAAQIHDFIVGELQEAYETQVGERGIRLSGGQRQRIGIARALYRDPPVLFMDEATSALDEDTEAALSEAIRNLSKKKTIVVIAHRDASLKNCDRLVGI